MYKRILVTLDNSPADDTILAHVKELARFCRAEVVLAHVADGFVARNQKTFNLAESEEMKGDRQYLERRVSEVQSAGSAVRSILACGEPATEILAIAEREKCDLIAMATHGHRFLGDLFLGSVAENIRHRTGVPILMIRKPK